MIIKVKDVRANFPIYGVGHKCWDNFLEETAKDFTDVWKKTKE